MTPQCLPIKKITDALFECGEAITAITARWPAGKQAGRVVASPATQYDGIALSHNPSFA